MNCKDVSDKLCQLDLPPISEFVKQQLESIMSIRRERMGCLFECRDRLEEDEYIKLIENDNFKIHALHLLYLTLLDEEA